MKKKIIVMVSVIAMMIASATSVFAGTKPVVLNDNFTKVDNSIYINMYEIQNELYDHGIILKYNINDNGQLEFTMINIEDNVYA